MTDKETLKLALDDLIVEYDMERTSFAKRVDEIFKQALALDKKAENARALGLDYEPVGWWDSKIGFFEEKHFDQLQPLYTTPPAAPVQDVSLIDEGEIESQLMTKPLIARLKHPEDHYEFTDPKKANAVLMSLCQEAADALAAPVQDNDAHYKGVVEGVQKLFDDKRAQTAIVLQQAYRTSDAYTIGFRDGQALSAPVPEGWRLVPVEPTDEMLAAADEGDREYTLRNFGDVQTVMQGPYDHYVAMIAAATPPAQPAPVQEPVAEIVSDALGCLTTRWSDEWVPNEGDNLYTHPPQPEQEPEYRCCPHDSDCAVHNMPAYPAGPCDCTYKNTFNTPPSTKIHEVCLALAKREIDKLTHENFGRTPNDAWANKVIDVYDFFDSNPKAKKLTVIYTAPPAAQPAQGETK